MTRIKQALCWAFAIILLAVGVAVGLVDRDAAQTLFIVLPVVAWLSITGRMAPCQITARTDA